MFDEYDVYDTHPYAKPEQVFNFNTLKTNLFEDI